MSPSNYFIPSSNDVFCVRVDRGSSKYMTGSIGNDECLGRVHHQDHYVYEYHHCDDLHMIMNKILL